MIMTFCRSNWFSGHKRNNEIKFPRIFQIRKESRGKEKAKEKNRRQENGRDGEAIRHKKKI